jgi:hypothetical protein
VTTADARTFVAPQHLWVPDNAGTFGDEIIDFGRQFCGLDLDPEQELAINSMAVHDKHGHWSAAEVVIVQPRQNGKTNHVIMPIALWDLFCTKPDLMVWTAHRFKTSSEAFGDLKKIIDGNYALRRRVKKVSESHGEESVELISGAAIYFLARSKSGGRGLGSKRPILDEAFALQSGQLGALLPTILARGPSAQIMYASSAGLADSEPLRSIRDRGRAGGDDSLVYLEWCAPGSWDEPGCVERRCNHHRSTPGCALDRVENHNTANPARVRGRITERAIATMRKGLTALEFGREVLGWWDEPDESNVSPITAADWAACVDETSTVEGSVCLSFDIAPDRSTAAIAIAGRRSDGIDHAELVRYDNGVDWLAGEIAALASKHKLLTIRQGTVRRKAIVCDPSGPAAALLPDLQRLKIQPVLMTARDMGAACGGLQDAVSAGPSAFRHLGQLQVDLAIEGAVRRDVGDGGWAFGRKRSAQVAVDICPLVAVTAARWGLTVSRPPQRDIDFAWSED